jgi:hypothetical protein
LKAGEKRLSEQCSNGSLTVFVTCMLLLWVKYLCLTLLSIDTALDIVGLFFSVDASGIGLCGLACCLGGTKQVCPIKEKN